MGSEENMLYVMSFVSKLGQVFVLVGENGQERRVLLDDETTQ